MSTALEGDVTGAGPAQGPGPPAAILRPAAWILAVAGMLKTHADPDLWGHVRFGLDIIRDRSLPHVDPYSFTQDVPWVNHEWLSEALMGTAFTAGGAAGLVVLKVVIVGVSFWLIAGSVRHTADHVRWPALCLAFWGALPLTTTVRPQLWTLLLLAVLCRTLAGDPRRLWAVPLLFVPWANAHGGWIVGMGVLAAWSAGVALMKPQGGPPARVLAVVTVASLAATLITPYGWGLWEFIAGTVRLSRADIGEWHPIWRDSSVTVLQWLVAVAFIGAALRWLVRPHPAVLGVLAVLAFSSLRVNRLVPLFIVAAVMLVGRQVAARTDAAPASRARTAIDLAAVAIAMVVAVSIGAIPRCIAITGTWTPDPPGMRALSAAEAEGRLVTWFEWGEYAIWHLGPELRVSIDGRRETVYSERVLGEQVAIGLGRPEGLAVLERMAPEYVWLPADRSRGTAEWLERHGYRIDVETGRSFVAVRGDLLPLAPVSAAAAPCFPGS